MTELLEILNPDFLLRQALIGSVLVGLVCPLVGVYFILEIVQWQPALEEALHPWRMHIAVDARLIDVATGRVVWTAHLPLRLVPTPGAVTRADADMIAEKRVAKELFAS